MMSGDHISRCTFKERKMLMMTAGSNRRHVLSELPKEILEQIVYRMGNFADYVRFRAVSKSWRSLLPERPFDHHQQLLPRQYPWLVLNSSDNNHQLCHGFFSFSENRIHRLLDSITNKENQGLLLFGFSHGWLITVAVAKTNRSAISLLNPITGDRIHLPPLTTSPHDYISEVQRPTSSRCWSVGKFILTSNPTAGTEFMVIAMVYSNKLALYQSKYDRWKLIDLVPQRVGMIQGAVHINGKIYILNYDHHLYAHDINSGELKLIIQRKPQFNRRGSLRLSWMMEMCGELLLVSSADSKNYYDYESIGFQVFKVVMEEDAEEEEEEEEEKGNKKDVGGEFVEMKSVGDHALFVGERIWSSFSFLVDTNRGGNGIIRRNCIYWGKYVYNLEDGSITTIPFLSTHLPQGIIASSIWFIPEP